MHRQATTDTTGGSSLLLLIGIAGPTRSGKTTLARSLSEHFERSGGADTVRTVHQDHFLQGGETPDAVNWRGFLTEIRRATSITDQQQHPSPSPSTVVATPCKTSRKNAQRRVVVIVEGFLLFAHPQTAALFDVKIFLQIPMDVCYARRIATKRAGLPPGRTFESFFSKTIWAAFEAHGNLATTVNDVVVIDGTKGHREVMDCALEAIGRAAAALPFNSNER